MHGRFPLALLVSSIWAVALAACGRDGSAATLDVPLQLAPGESAVFEDEQLAIRFLDVSDSRCPTDVDCFWAGEVVVRLAVRSHGKESELKLKELQRGVVDGNVIEILEVLPPRGPQERRIAPADYRVTLKVSRQNRN